MGESRLADNLETALKKTERYSLVALSSAVVFVALALPNPTSEVLQKPVEMELLGIPISASPPWLLIAVYIVYFGSCLIADNMAIHVQRLASQLDDNEKTREIMTYPTVHTVSPVARFVVTICSAILIIFSLTKIYFQGVYSMHWLLWLLAYGWAFGGVWLYVRIRSSIMPFMPVQESARLQQKP